MAVWQLVQNRSTRIAIVVGWSIAAIAWLLGPELIFSLGSADGRISAISQLEYRVVEVFIFVVCVAVVAYIVLGSGQRDAADKRYYQPLVNGATLGAAYTDPIGTICYANPAFLRLFDLSHAAMGQIGLQELLRGWFYTAPQAGLFPTVGRVEMRAQLDIADGETTEIMLTITPARDQHEGFLLFASDVTTVTKLEQAQALLDGTVQSLEQALTVCDASRPGLPIVFANLKAQAMTGFSLAELYGTPWSMLQGPDRNQLGLVQLRAALKQKRPGTAVVRCYHKDGTPIETETSSSLLFDQSGKLTHVAYLQSDVTAAAANQGALNRALHVDNISGLFNRAGFIRELTTLLTQPAERWILVALIDIKNFDEFNTSAGWDLGDALLREFARRLSGALPTALLGRLESDQFAIGLPVTPDEIEDQAESILKAVSGRVTLPGLTSDPAVSMGYTVTPGGSLTRTAMQQASVALSEACGRVGGPPQQFNKEIETKLTERRRLTAELRQAIQDRNFVVHYQPKVELTSGLIVGAEALARWNHPLFGIQQSIGLSELAEQTGMILDIAEFVLTEAAQFAAMINHGGRACIPVTINLPAAQLALPDFVSRLGLVLEGAGALPSWIRLTMTEATYVRAAPTAHAALSQLMANGVGLTMNDLGAGCSSLQFLTQSHVNEVKIDQCFIRGIEHASVNRAIVKAILNIGNASGAQVVVDGIEEEAEYEALLDLGCIFGQGSFIGRPVNSAEFHEMVALDVKLPLKPTDRLPLVAR